MYNDALSGSSSPVLDKVTFTGNSAVNFGGALFNVGNAGTSSPHLTNVTFSGNSAKNGGAMFSVADTGGTSSPVLTNVTFNGNSAALVGGAVDSYVVSGSSHPLLTNVILWGDTASSSAPEVIGDATINKSIVQGGCPAGSSCSNLVAGNPLLGPLGDNGGPTPTMQLGVGSAAIDSGDDGNCPATDQRGIDRPQGPHCDIGAIESERLFADGFDGATAP
jgi:predicted outer membrane repeat protein